MINDLPRSKTIIIITHDKEILQHLDNVYDLNNLHKSYCKKNKIFTFNINGKTYGSI